jgi:cytochrome c-type biogenesis protein
VTDTVETQELVPSQNPDACQVESKTRIRLRIVMACLLFSLGFSLVFVSLGAAAGTVGEWLKIHRQLFNLISGIVIIVLGLFILGLVKFRILYNERRFHFRRFGLLTAPLAGMAFAFGWTPCVGPFLYTLLTLAADSGNSAHGAFYLAIYSAGLALPFLVSALLLTSLLGTLNWLKRRMGIINAIAGLLLIATGLLLVLGRFTEVSAISSKLTDHLFSLLRIKDPTLLDFGNVPGVVTSFAAGLLSFLSPCVLPLVPGYLSLISGLSLEEITHQPKQA